MVHLVREFSWFDIDGFTNLLGQCCQYSNSPSRTRLRMMANISRGNPTQILYQMNNPVSGFSMLKAVEPHPFPHPCQCYHSFDHSLMHAPGMNSPLTEVILCPGTKVLILEDSTRVPGSSICGARLVNFTGPTFRHIRYKYKPSPRGQT